jgi:hypothetical protein
MDISSPLLDCCARISDLPACCSAHFSTKPKHKASIAGFERSLPLGCRGALPIRLAIGYFVFLQKHQG